MTNKNKNKFKIQLFISGISGATTILCGAFSAHALENMVKTQYITQQHVEIFEKAVKYQMYHSIVLLILVLSNIIRDKLIFRKSFWMIFTGITFFSGSLYWITIQKIVHIYFPKFLSFITPLGGLLMVAGWIMIIIEAKGEV